MDEHLHGDRAPRPGELTFETATTGSRVVVSLRGELDLLSAPNLASELESLQSDDAGELVIDLGGVAFMDSTGLRALLAESKRADEAGNKLLFRRAHGQVRRLFEIAGVLDQFSFDDQ